MRHNFLLIAIATGLAALDAPGAAAQATDEGQTVYHREVFQYTRAGRPDPFRSLLNSAELGVRFEDLSLQGIVYHPDPSRSVVVLAQTGSSRRVRARAGERIGPVRILSIRPRSVEVVVEEFGVARRETLELKSLTGKGELE